MFFASGASPMKALLDSGSYHRLVAQMEPWLKQRD